MVNLVIDIGNTFTKTAVFNNRKIVESYVSDGFRLHEIQEIIGQRKIDHAIVSSVDQDIEDLESYLKQTTAYLRFHAGIQVGIVNRYKTPETLGLDRLAAVIGAGVVSAGKNNLVIDAGTCITYDFIDSNKNYWGGSISPGITLRFKAMHTFTGRLPLIEADTDFDESSGLDTRRAMLSGVQYGAFKEVLGFIEDYAGRYADLQVILCGGDAKFFDTRLKNSIFAPSLKIEPNLVLIGLNEVIHQYSNA